MSDGACSGEHSEAWIDVATAVEYLRATHRPGLTVWGALAEAVRWWIEGASWQADAGRGGGSLPWSDPDPLRTALESLLGVVGQAGTLDGRDLPTVMDGALCSWLDAMAEAFNDGSGFARRA